VFEQVYRAVRRRGWVMDELVPRGGKVRLMAARAFALKNESDANGICLLAALQLYYNAPVVMIEFTIE
jgi:hypothetical protein